MVERQGDRPVATATSSELRYRLRLLGTSECPRTRNSCTSSLTQHLRRFDFVKRHHALKLRRLDGRVDLRGVDLRVTEQRAPARDRDAAHRPPSRRHGVGRVASTPDSRCTAHRLCAPSFKPADADVD